MSRADASRGRDHASLVADLVASRCERAAQLGDRAALARARPQREIDPLAELWGKITALAAQRRQMRAQTARAQRGAARADGVDPGQRLVDDRRKRDKVGGGARRQTLRLL